MTKRLASLTLVFFLAVSLSGCIMTTPSNSESVQDASFSAQSKELLEEAERLIAEGRLEEAATCLDNLPPRSLTQEQMQLVVRLHLDITQKQKELQEESPAEVTDKDET